MLQKLKCLFGQHIFKTKVEVDFLIGAKYSVRRCEFCNKFKLGSVKELKYLANIKDLEIAVEEMDRENQLIETPLGKALIETIDN